MYCRNVEIILNQERTQNGKHRTKNYGFNSRRIEEQITGILQGNVLSGVVDKIKQQYPDLYKKVEESEGQIPEDVKQKLTEVFNNFTQQK